MERKKLDEDRVLRALMALYLAAPPGEWFSPTPTLVSHKLGTGFATTALLSAGAVETRGRTKGLIGKSTRWVGPPPTKETAAVVLNKIREEQQKCNSERKAREVRQGEAEQKEPTRREEQLPLDLGGPEQRSIEDRGSTAKEYMDAWAKLMGGGVAVTLLDRLCILAGYGQDSDGNQAIDSPYSDDELHETELTCGAVGLIPYILGNISSLVRTAARAETAAMAETLQSMDAKIDRLHRIWEPTS